MRFFGFKYYTFGVGEYYFRKVRDREVLVFVNRFVFSLCI